MLRRRPQQPDASMALARACEPSRAVASGYSQRPSCRTDEPRPGPTTRRFVAWTLRHGRTLWLLAVLLAIPAAWRTAPLYRNLRSEVEELLPRDAPSVVAIDELRARMAGLQYLGVVDRRRRPPGSRRSSRRRSGWSTTSRRACAPTRPTS